MRLSIIIPVYNCLEYTKQCIESIRENTIAYEIIIVNNGSTDGTLEWLQSQKVFDGEIKEEYGKIWAIKDGIVCSLDKNVGYAAGNNKGMELATGDYVCLLNNDTIVTPGWDDILINHLKKGYNVIGPCTNYIAGKQRKIVDVYNTKETLNEAARTFNIKNRYRATEVNWVIGYCFMISLSDLCKIGYLDEMFGIGNSEDIDYCIRAKNLGMKIAIAEDCYIHHFGSKTFVELNNQFGPNFYNNLLRENSNKLIEKWGEINFAQ